MQRTSRSGTALLGASVVLIAAAARGAPPAHVDDFVPTYRWVGFLEHPLADPLEEPCPDPVNESEWLFARLYSPRAAAEALRIPPSDPTFLALLNSVGTPDPPNGVWCVYEARERPRSVAEADARAHELPEVFAPGRLQPDPAIVVPYGESDPDLISRIAKGLHEHALDHLGAVSRVPAEGGERVRVAVLDSALPSAVPGYPGYGRFSHGRDMALLIRQLVCAHNAVVGEGCAVGVYNYLALDQVPDGTGGAFTDRVNGGYFGTVTQLGSSTWMAWFEWQLVAPATKLVLNYSVGWEPLQGMPIPSEAEQAFVAALREARCRGALAVAAAGNDHDGPVPSIGPAFPAGLELGEFDCGGLPTHEPLAYSAGGIDGHARPIANAREQGRPNLAAYAFSVGADERYLSSENEDAWFATPPLTGSSLAAAAVSAIAAAAWSILDGSAAEVMNAVYETGVPLGEQADYLGTNQQPEIRRVSMCLTLASLVPGAYVCSTPVAGNPSWKPDQLTEFENAATSVQLTLGKPTQACSNATHYPLQVFPLPRYSPFYKAQPGACPDQQLYNDTVGPQVRSQPGSPVCTVCTVKMNAVGGGVYVELNPALEDSVQRLQLKVSSTSLQYVDLAGEVEVGTPLVYTGLPSALGNAPDATVELVATVDDGDLVVLTQSIPVSP